MTPLLRDLPPDERERQTSVIWAAQDPRSPTCDYCGEFRELDWQWGHRKQCYCEARLKASRPQGEEGA